MTCSAIWGLLDKDDDLKTSHEHLNTERNSQPYFPMNIHRPVCSLSHFCLKDVQFYWIIFADFLFLSFFQYEKILFTDDVTVSVNLSLDTNLTLESGDSQIHVVIGTDVVYNKTCREGNPTCEDNTLHTGYSVVEFNMTLSGMHVCVLHMLLKPYWRRHWL